VLRIKRLLYDEGFTIAGARRHLREEGESPGAVTEGRTTEDRTTETHAWTESADAEDTSALEAGSGMEAWLAAEDGPPAQGHMAAERAPEAPATIGRKVLLDMRDSLRAFLTLLENE
jgi:hypothetical protein